MCKVGTSHVWSEKTSGPGAWFTNSDGPLNQAKHHSTIVRHPGGRSVAVIERAPRTLSGAQLTVLTIVFHSVSRLWKNVVIPFGMIKSPACISVVVYITSVSIVPDHQMALFRLVQIMGRSS